MKYDQDILELGKEHGRPPFSKKSLELMDETLWKFVIVEDCRRYQNKGSTGTQSQAKVGKYG